MCQPGWCSKGEENKKNRQVIHRYIDVCLSVLFVLETIIIFVPKRTNKGSVIKGLRIREDEVFEDLAELEEIEE